jgi:hypothetical protein
LPILRRNFSKRQDSIDFDRRNGHRFSKSSAVDAAEMQSRVVPSGNPNA